MDAEARCRAVEDAGGGEEEIEVAKAARRDAEARAATAEEKLSKVEQDKSELRQEVCLSVWCSVVVARVCYTCCACVGLCCATCCILRFFFLLAGMLYWVEAASNLSVAISLCFSPLLLGFAASLSFLTCFELARSFSFSFNFQNHETSARQAYWHHIMLILYTEAGPYRVEGTSCVDHHVLRGHILYFGPLCVPARMVHD